MPKICYYYGKLERNESFFVIKWKKNLIQNVLALQMFVALILSV